MTVRGLLLAAGAGRRMGRPKALVEDDRGPWLLRAVEALEQGGCDGVTVVLGAGADEARSFLDPSRVHVVVAADWAEGMGASLRAGLAALPDDADALVHLVDLPDVGPEVVARLLARGGGLARAAYDGVPGHPVLIGRAHVADVRASAAGDSGARDYLAAHDVALVECGDLASGADVDAWPAAAPGTEET